MGMVIWERLEDETSADFGEQTLGDEFAESSDRKRGLWTGNYKGSDNLSEVFVVFVVIVDRDI